MHDYDYRNDEKYTSVIVVGCWLIYSNESNEAKDLSLKRMEICFKTPPSSQSVDQEMMDYDADSNWFPHEAKLSVLVVCFVWWSIRRIRLVCMYWLYSTMLSTHNNLHTLWFCISNHTGWHCSIRPSHSCFHQRIKNVQFAIPSTCHCHPCTHLTRSPQNSHHLVFKYTELLLTLQNATNSDYDKAWKYGAQHKPQHGQVVTRSHCTHSQNDCESHGTVQKRQKWGGIGSRGLDSKSVGRTGQSH